MASEQTWPSPFMMEATARGMPSILQSLSPLPSTSIAGHRNIIRCIIVAPDYRFEKGVTIATDSGKGTKVVDRRIKDGDYIGSSSLFLRTEEVGESTSSVAPEDTCGFSFSLNSKN